MALQGLSAEQKAALANIVAPETLHDIEEYIRPQFPSRKTSLTDDSSVASVKNDIYTRRRIVKDGHGRWREVRPHVSLSPWNTSIDNRVSSDLNLSPRWTNRSHVEPHVSKSLGLGNRTETFREETFSDNDKQGKTKWTQKGRHSSKESAANGKEIPFANYDNISMFIRSNVFPGLGNNKWNSTTTDAFTELVVTPPAQRAKFFGIQTDGFGKWSAANVHHEKMKKKWDEYLHSLPKQAANWKPKEVTEVVPKVNKPDVPQPKIKKAKTKKSIQQPLPDVQEVDVPPGNQVPPEKPPVDIPIDNDDDDNFWDFYNKPFNRPTK